MNRNNLQLVRDDLESRTYLVYVTNQDRIDLAFESWSQTARMKLALWLNRADLENLVHEEDLGEAIDNFQDEFEVTVVS